MPRESDFVTLLNKLTHEQLRVQTKCSGWSTVLDTVKLTLTVCVTVPSFYAIKHGLALSLIVVRTKDNTSLRSVFLQHP